MLLFSRTFQLPLGELGVLAVQKNDFAIILTLVPVGLGFWRHLS